ncbi:MAG: DNA-processing protein DprA [candidate division WOR-3 bacterium]|nr:DNA-processing protein DprA [candidate division WOR-3 bacterium]
MKDETFELLHLLSIDALKVKDLHELIDNFGSCREVVCASREDLLGIVGEKAAAAIKSFAISDTLLRKKRKLAEMTVNITPYYAPEYPEWLTLIDRFPPILFIRGNIVPGDELSIAVIGTRGATVYGKEIARKFAAEFALAGVTVVSGMARGIDTEAHRGALQNKGRTIAVLGCGVDTCYPPENKTLMTEIVASGAVISEFDIGTPPLAHNFPRRNRIVSGLAKAVVAIEAKEKSGVMNTVKWALEQNKEVFAVPGNIFAKTSRGTNRLIKEGATPATSPDEVLEYLGVKKTEREMATQNISLDQDENIIWEALSCEPIFLDALAEKLDQPTSSILNILLKLEIKGYVKQLPGMSFVRKFE